MEDVSRIFAKLSLHDGYEPQLSERKKKLKKDCEDLRRKRDYEDRQLVISNARKNRLIKASECRQMFLRKKRLQKAFECKQILLRKYRLQRAFEFRQMFLRNKRLQKAFECRQSFLRKRKLQEIRECNKIIREENRDEMVKIAFVNFDNEREETQRVNLEKQREKRMKSHCKLFCI